MLEKGKNYEVKEWFANKIAQEMGRNIESCVELFKEHWRDFK